jgi:hypothetical protein
LIISNCALNEFRRPTRARFAQSASMSCADIPFAVTNFIS